MLTQNKKRLFDKEKSEYTFRSLNSILTSLHQAKKFLPEIEFDIVIIDYNSKKSDLDQMQKQLNESHFKNSVISLNLDEFKNKIKKNNAENKVVTENQISNMSNIHKSLLIAKNQCKDLIYFVEDDYLHKDNSIEEMIYTYEKLSTLFNDELFLCPIDYPYLYMEPNKTNILIGNSHHWRRIDQTLCTFLTSSQMINRHFNQLVSMCEKEHYPFEKPLHEIYKKEYCFSPIPSLAVHFTNINSIYGISPNVNLDKLWKENE
jgi:glutamate racemase